MRKVRVLVCLVFLASCIIFGAYTVKTRLVEDNTPPKITCESDEIAVSVKAEDAEILKGVSAKDNRDGDISKSVTISSMSHFISKGKRTVTYIVFDEANQAGTAQRTLTYTDYTSPRIHLLKPLRYTNKQIADTNFLENMTAEDCLDGDLSKQIRTTLSDSFYSEEAGEYEMTIQVSNSAGDVCRVPVTMQIVNGADREENQKSYPMLSEYIVYTKLNVPLDLNAYLTGVVKGGNEYTFAEDAEYMDVGVEDISVTSNVDYTKAGVYTAEFTCSAEEQPTAVTKLVVVVEE